MQEIKLQDCEQRRRWEWEDSEADLFTLKMKSLKLQQTQEAGSVVITEIKDIVITVISATSVIHGDMTLGMMLAVQYIIGQLSLPVEQLMNFFYAVQDVKISLERINEIYTLTNEDDEEKRMLSQTSPTEGIEINHVSFKYDSNAPHDTLCDISLRIPQGKITAIVGSSGCGKTTLIKLLLGYYSPYKGRIVLGGY